MKMKSFGLTETKLFHFHWIFKNKGADREGGKQTPSGSATASPVGYSYALNVRFSRDKGQ